jgi:predicted dehydrogenase
LGEPVLGTIEMRAIPHWMPWSRGLPSLATFVMSIHHLDTFRFWFGTPDRVLASTRPDPRTGFAHRDGINLYILEYDGGCRAASWDDVWTGPAREGAEGDIYIRWRVEGTEGLARGTIGWPGYPARTPSTLDFTTKRQPGSWFQPRWQEVWFPDAFAGTMAQLLCALEDGAEPELSGRDNLETIALCEAVFAAATQGRVTTVREFLRP